MPEVHPGDIVRVHQKIKEGDKERTQIFEGIVIATHRKTGSNATFTVRKIASGVGVEKTFLLHSPNIIKIEFKKGSQVRRAKLYYLRNLSGKGLRLREKQLDKDVWELVAGEDQPVEASTGELTEAVAAAEAKSKSEAAGEHRGTAEAPGGSTEEPGTAELKDDTVGQEVEGGEQAQETQS